MLSLSPVSVAASASTLALALTVWHPSRVHLHLIMINATQLSWRGELLRLPRCCKGSKGATLVVVAAAVVLPLVAGTTAEPKRHATCCCIIRSGKRHSNILAENAILICLWPTHTQAHTHTLPPYAGICLWQHLQHVASQIRKLSTAKALLVFSSRSRTTVAHVLHLPLPPFSTLLDDVCTYGVD